MPVRPIDNLLASLGYLRTHPVVSVALGGSLVLANVAVCCVFGALAAPWFGCELFAFQLGIATGSRRLRSKAWIGAGLLVLGAVLIVSSGAWLTALGLAAEVPVAGLRDGPAELPMPLVAVSGIALSLVYLLPLIYAAPILIDRGGSFGGAVMQSAWLVHEDGFFGHLRLTVLSHLVQLSPLMIAAVIAWAALEPSAVPLAVLASTPLLAVSLPVGQGMIVAAWVERRERAAGLGAVRPPRPLVVLMAAVVVAPAVSIAMVGASLARPSRPAVGHAPTGEVVVDVAPDHDRDIGIADTALTLHVSRGSIAVEASDGGGVGPLPFGGDGDFERARVVRVRSAYAVEATRAGTTRVTWIDRAGVRLDDDLGARLADRMAGWGLLALALSMLLVPVVLGPAVAALAQHGASRTRGAWWRTALVAPFCVLSFAAALLAIA